MVNPFDHISGDIMQEDWIAEEVEQYFAASPIGPMLEVSHVARNKNHPLSQILRKTFAFVPEKALTSAKEHPDFAAQYGHLGQEEQDWFAREQAIIGQLRWRNQCRRRDHLLRQDETARPAPYDEPALEDVPVSRDRLVPLSAFKVCEGALMRNGRAYIMLPPTPSENSSYWITRALFAGGLQDNASVRLDPLIRGPAGSFPLMSYRMLWYGPPLLWRDIADIRKESFGRWAPGSLSGAGDYTDFAWIPRDNELHLLLEEVPKSDDAQMSASRYLHAILSRNTGRVVHLDGAIRLYTECECQARKSKHVHRAGKTGARIKVFCIDKPICPDVVSSLGGTYFVWNYDVARFFGASVPPSLLGKED